MDELTPNPIFDAAAEAHQAGRFAVGSLWWISEQIWRHAGALSSKWGASDSMSHPGIFVSQPYGTDLPFIRIHVGRSPKPYRDHPNDIILELRPRQFPGKKTKFAGRDGFIGQVRLSRLLKGEHPWNPRKPRDQNWLYPNLEVPAIDPPQLATLLAWVASTTSSPPDV